MAEYHNDRLLHREAPATEPQVTPFIDQAHDYDAERPEVASPRQIVAELHARIAAKSPEHASLVARFDELRATRERQTEARAARQVKP